VIYVLYGFVLVGVGLLVADLLGRLTARRASASFMRTIGVAAASIATIGPVAVLFNAQWVWPYPLFPAAYVALYVAFVASTYGRLGRRSIPVQRLAYAGYLLLVAFPSWELLLLTPAIALAGVALVRDRPFGGTA
jgi:hypothetical protein